MKISVIIPVYNVRDYLDACLDSVAGAIDAMPAQWRGAVEVLVINDGSTDGSERLAMSHCELRGWRYFSQPNAGLSAARNVGIEQSGGDYLTFIDSDDLIAVDFFSHHVEVLKALAPDCLTMGSYRFDDAGVRVAVNPSPSPRVTGSDWMMMLPKTTWARFYKRELFDGVRFPVGKLFEDMATTPLLKQAVSRHVYSPGEYYGYRRRVGSITRSTLNKQFDAIEAIAQLRTELPVEDFDRLLVSESFSVLIPFARAVPRREWALFRDHWSAALALFPATGWRAMAQHLRHYGFQRDRSLVSFAILKVLSIFRSSASTAPRKAE
ncbi:glycosyltransferase family 2 protein [Halotalea alkalilenta]|uniref:Glycosyltransferase 2-like domain-containing protein n=1 Tax=Halotalea alkalilenta TaxID=376489 RepID=A0A172YFD3_9GAMM|nr:glycosyltransferase family 2 protein [Halotalea alkalilenta]ANF57782.1 hypothetical protein A5892_10160 [Halotalea alkalilenta]